MFLSFAALREQGFRVHLNRKADGVDIKSEQALNPESATVMHSFQHHFGLSEDDMDEVMEVVLRVQLARAIRNALETSPEMVWRNLPVED